MALFTNQESRLLTVATPLGEDVLLLAGFNGREELSRLFTYELDLLSEEEAIAPRDLVGKGISWSVNHQDREPRHFHGIVRRFGAGALHLHGLRTYRAEVVPWLWFLTRTSNCRIFQNKTTPQIIEMLFQEYGFKDYEPMLKRAYPPWEYCVQYRESAFDFLSRLMEHEGIFYYFRHEEGQHTLVLADHKGAYKDCVENQVAYSSGSLAPNHIDAWEHQCEFRSGRWAATDYNFETPSTNLLTTSNTLMKLPGVDRFEFFDYPGDFRDKKEGEADVKVRMEEEEASHDVVVGAGNCCTFTPGGKFTLETHDIASEAGKSYVLTSVQHTAHDASYGQNGKPSSYRNTFTCIPSTVVFRPARVTPQPVVHGPQTAVVVGPASEKIFCDKYGRIKVQFHWDRLGKKNEESSCWVRVSQNWGGAKWGGVFIPHVGQEVIVEFEEGDPDRPLITGRVYNAEIMPPLELPDNKTKSVIRDHGGNQIIMEGHDGVQQIKMYSPYAETEFIMGAPHSPGDGFFLRTKHFFESIIGKNSTEMVKKNKTVTVGGHQVEAVARSRSEVTKGMRVEMTKGRMTETVQGKVVIVNAKDRSETIRGAQTVQVKKKQTELTERDREAMVKGDYKMESEQLISLRGKKIYAGGTEEVVIQDGKQIILQCGESKITLKQNGTVIIQGNAIHFIAKKDIQAVAKENLTLKGGTFALKSSTGAGEVNAKATLDVKGQMVKINPTSEANTMTLPAARRLDRTLHGPPLNGAGAPNVKIGHRNAWRVGDFHSCSMMNAPPPAGPGTPHVGGAVLKGSFTVLIGMQPAARQTDVVIEPAAIPPPMPPNNVILSGANNVLIGDIPFGLADPANLAAFCAEWTKLRAEWPNMKEWQRRVDTQKLLNNALRRAGVPRLEGLGDSERRPGALGAYSRKAHAINMPDGFFKRPSLSGSVGRTFLHEARHATQYHNVARHLASQGHSAGTIAAKTNMHESLAQAGAAKPAGLGTAAGQHGAMTSRQKFDETGPHGKAWDREVRAASDAAHGTPQQRQADQNYYGLPNEADAEGVALALEKICPAARGP